MDISTIRSVQEIESEIGNSYKALIQQHYNLELPSLEVKINGSFITIVGQNPAVSTDGSIMTMGIGKRSFLTGWQEFDRRQLRTLSSSIEALTGASVAHSFVDFSEPENTFCRVFMMDRDIEERD